MALVQTTTDAEALAIAVAVTTLTSSVGDCAELVRRLRTSWRDRVASRANAAELEMLQQSLVLAQSTVRRGYDTYHQRYGHVFRVGDDQARCTLFMLAARQATLLKDLQSTGFKDVNIQRLIASTESTKLAAAGSLNSLAARCAQRAVPAPPFRLEDHVALLTDYLDLCPSAALYRTGRAPHARLAAVARNRGQSVCHRCRATLVPCKMAVPGADASSYVLMDLSGLLRAHCVAGRAWACIWRARVPACFAAFPDPKALLKHMLAAHVRDGDPGADDTEVDWPMDVRRGDLARCGYLVRINGALMMRSDDGRLLVPRRRSSSLLRPMSGSSESFATASSAAGSMLGVTTTGSETEEDWEVMAAEMDPSSVLGVATTGSETEDSEVMAAEMDPSESRQRYEIDSNEIFEMPA